MAEQLGEDYEIVEEALSGRTTNVDDPIDPAAQRGRLPAGRPGQPPAAGPGGHHAGHQRHQDLLRPPGVRHRHRHRDADRHRAGVGGGVGTAYPAPEILVVAPPPLGEVTDPWHGWLFAGGREKTEQFGEVFAAACDTFGAEFLDAGTVTTTQGADGIRLSVDNNRDVGAAVAQKVRAIIA